MNESDINYLHELYLIPEFFLAVTAVTLIIHCSLVSYSKMYSTSVLGQFSVTSLSILILFLTLVLYLHEGSLAVKHLSLEFTFLVDSLGFLSKILTITASLICIYLIQDHILEYKLNSTEDELLIMLYAVLGLAMLIGANDFGTIFLALELQSLSLYILSRFKTNSIYSVENGLKYFILGALSTAYFLLGWSLLYGISGLFILLNFHPFFFNIYLDAGKEKVANKTLHKETPCEETTSGFENTINAEVLSELSLSSNLTYVLIGIYELFCCDICKRIVRRFSQAWEIQGLRSAILTNKIEKTCGDLKESGKTNKTCESLKVSGFLIRVYFPDGYSESIKESIQKLDRRLRHVVYITYVMRIYGKDLAVGLREGIDVLLLIGRYPAAQPAKYLFIPLDPHSYLKMAIEILETLIFWINPRALGKLEPLEGQKPERVMGQKLRDCCFNSLWWWDLVFARDRRARLEYRRLFCSDLRRVIQLVNDLYYRLEFVKSYDGRADLGRSVSSTHIQRPANEVVAAKCLALRDVLGYLLFLIADEEDTNSLRYLLLMGHSGSEDLFKLSLKRLNKPELWSRKSYAVYPRSHPVY